MFGNNLVSFRGVYLTDNLAVFGRRTHCNTAKQGWVTPNVGKKDNLAALFSEEPHAV